MIPNEPRELNVIAAYQWVEMGPWVARDRGKVQGLYFTPTVQVVQYEDGGIEGAVREGNDWMVGQFTADDWREIVQ